MRLAMAERADDSKRKVPRIPDPGHHHGKPKELRRRLTDQSHEHPGDATDEITEQHIHGNEPPLQHIGERHGLPELREDEARQEEGEHQFAEQSRRRRINDVDPTLR